MRIWIRSLSGDVRDVPGADEGTALDAWGGYDWAAGIAGYDPDKDSVDHCRPAYGIKDGERAAIDFTPMDAETCRVNLFCLEDRRLLGFVKYQTNVHRYAERFARDRVPDSIRLFYAGDVVGLKALVGG